MQIRDGNIKDPDLVSALDHAFMTDQVWQLNVREDGPERTANLRLSPLPRMVRMNLALDTAALRRVVHRSDFLYVAHEPGQAPLLGYIGMQLAPGQNAVWLSAACVVNNHRRKGIGRQLLAHALAKASALKLSMMMADVQTKNVPATRWLEANGFKFSGYADNYYATQDIALFYMHRVR